MKTMRWMVSSTTSTALFWLLQSLGTTTQAQETICFETNEELRTAVLDYVETNASTTSAVAQTYGHPIGTWCVDRVANGNLSRVFEQLQTFNEDISAWNTSSATSMSGMFFGAVAFNSDLSSWDVSNVVDMKGIFQYATVFNPQQSLSNWNVAKVQTLEDAFSFAEEFEGRGLEDWSTQSLVNMNDTFWKAIRFNANIGGWNVEKVTTMHRAFAEAFEFDADLSGWKPRSCADFSYMFWDARSFRGTGVGAWDLSSAVTMKSMFENATNLQGDDLGRWNVSNVKYFQHMFENCSSFNADISSWSLDSAEYMDYFFYEAKSFNVDLSDWSFGPNVARLANMFVNASSYAQNLCAWGDKLQKTVSVTDMFVGTSCPITTDPMLAMSPSGPWCFDCRGALASPTLTPIPLIPIPLTSSVSGIVVGKALWIVAAALAMATHHLL